MLGMSMLALAAQYPQGTAKFVLFDSTAEGSRDSAFLDQITQSVPHEVISSRRSDIGEIMNELAAELKKRSNGESGREVSAIFVFIHGLHRFKKLRQEDDFDFSSSGSDAGANPAGQFNELISEGSSHGIHLAATIDTFNNVNRFLSRKALSEFEMRVVFQMSANDSASLVDSPKASTLGLHRALFYNEHEGYMETFRPYAVPDPDWLHEAAKKLSQRDG